jgi:hypothetical protein
MLVTARNASYIATRVGDVQYGKEGTQPFSHVIGAHSCARAVARLAAVRDAQQ